MVIGWAVFRGLKLVESGRASVRQTAVMTSKTVKTKQESVSNTTILLLLRFDSTPCLLTVLDALIADHPQKLSEMCH